MAPEVARVMAVASAGPSVAGIRWERPLFVQPHAGVLTDSAGVLEHGPPRGKWCTEKTTGGVMGSWTRGWHAGCPVGWAGRWKVLVPNTA